MKRSLRFERLERRELLSGVTAVLSKGSLTVLGDFQADSFSISPGPDFATKHDLLVKGYGGTKVNGGNQADIMGITGDVSVLCFGQGCTVAVGGIKAGDPTLTLPGNLAVFCGGGPQDVLITNAMVTKGLGVTTFANAGQTVLGVPTAGFNVPSILGADNLTGPVQGAAGVFVMGGVNAYRVNISQVIAAGGLGVIGGAPSLVSIQDSVSPKGTTCAFGFSGNVNVDVDHLTSKTLVVIAWADGGAISLDGSHLDNVAAFLGKSGWTVDLGVHTGITVTGTVFLTHLGPETLNQGPDNHLGALIDLWIQP